MEQPCWKVYLRFLNQLDPPHLLLNPSHLGQAQRDEENGRLTLRLTSVEEELAKEKARTHEENARLAIRLKSVEEELAKEKDRTLALLSELDFTRSELKKEQDGELQAPCSRVCEVSVQTDALPENAQIDLPSLPAEAQENRESELEAQSIPSSVGNAEYPTHRAQASQDTNVSMCRNNVERPRDVFPHEEVPSDFISTRSSVSSFTSLASELDFLLRQSHETKSNSFHSIDQHSTCVRKDPACTRAAAAFPRHHEHRHARHSKPRTHTNLMTKGIRPRDGVRTISSSCRRSSLASVFDVASTTSGDWARSKLKVRQRHRQNTGSHYDHAYTSPCKSRRSAGAALDLNRPGLISGQPLRGFRYH